MRDAASERSNKREHYTELEETLSVVIDDGGLKAFILLLKVG
jgi:hypothetical protein